MSEPGQPSLAATLRNWWKQNSARQGSLTTLRVFFSELWGFLRDSTPEQRRRRYGDVEYDWDHRVDTTSATVGWRDRLLGVFHSPYQPTEPALFHEMLTSLAVNYPDFTFIDLGSGKGRTLLMASDYPFRKIVGVELLPKLNRIAQENLHKYSSPNQKCFALESICADAQAFQFPDASLVLYLFNPLPEAGLALVVENLEQSLREHPRPAFVLYHNPLLPHILDHSSFIERINGTHQYFVYRSSVR
jgi:SAM-dependent methyltransferase